MRNRNHVIKVSMNQEELEQYKRRLTESGKKSNQSFGLEALLDSKITSQEAVENLQKLNQALTKQQLNETRIGSNINQIAKIANSSGEVDALELDASLQEIQQMRKERWKLWQQLRSFLQAQK